MAEDSDLEKTEPASPRRLEKAREEGDVPRSRELATCTILLAACMGFWMLGSGMSQRINRMLTAGLTLDRELIFDPNLLFSHIANYLADVIIGFAPLAILLMIVALASPVLIGGWMVSAKALQPNFSRMNPLSGLGNMFSTRALVELGKAIGKALLVGVIAWITVSHQLPAMLDLAVEPVESGTSHMASLLLTGSAAIIGGLVIIALIDAPYQIWHYGNKLKMTREELRQEAKESDGNPEIKAKIRAQQREIARRRMMAEIPNADVVVTNPTHYAVALKYAEGKGGAPRVVAKGADEVAAKIREIAGEHRVPLLEAPPLARALFRHTELGDEIPEALYTAVAEVLAYVYQLRIYRERGGMRPDVPKEVDVPPELDPLNPAASAAPERR
ncbi:MAG: flhB [Paucimonas sp.]|nr:flhB [Paucimonas sp.]